MAAIKSLLRSGYQWTAANFGAHRQPGSKPRLWILMYHRILPLDDPRFHLEEPGMVVTPDTLRMHLQECRKLFEMVSLDEWVTAYQQGKPLPNKACAVTFDDGWQDNLDYADPILKEQNVPATLFAVVDKIGTDFRFWPNIVAELLAQQSPALEQHDLFRDLAAQHSSPRSRESLAAAIQQLKQHSEADIFGALEAIQWRALLSESPPALMKWADMNASHFDIGCHTQTHRRLTSWLSESELDYEIIGSATALKQHAPNAQSLFCYPNGDYDERALHRVRNTYQAAVTTAKGINQVGRLNLHELKRIPIHDDMANTPTKFRARLAAW